MLVFVYEKITNFADNGNFEIKMDNGLIYSDIELFWGGEEEECGGMELGHVDVVLRGLQIT